MFPRRHLAALISRRCINRRTFDVKERRQSPTDILEKTIENSNIKTAQDWKNVRNEILNVSGPRGSITPLNIDAMTIGICTSKKNYDLALSYLDFLEKEGIKPNLATLGKYFKLLYLKNVNDEVSQEDQDRILNMSILPFSMSAPLNSYHTKQLNGCIEIKGTALELNYCTIALALYIVILRNSFSVMFPYFYIRYKAVRENYPVLDASSLDNIILAISLTDNWKVCLDLLEEIKVTATPSAGTYNALIAAAFRNNEDVLAWTLFTEMLDKDRNVFSEVYSSYFKKMTKHSNKSNLFKELEVMFNFLQKYSLKLDNDNLESLTDLSKKVNCNIQPSSVNQSGICKRCKSQLKMFDLSDEEFNDLKAKILQNVIVGKDVFNRTTPDELKKFQNFVSTMDNFDVVVDGLNVAYSAGVRQSSQVTSGLVAAVVSHFVTQGQKVLVLGRIHMSRWPKQNWGYVLKNATVFLTQNLSQDDPYLLYCALNSGKDTIVVSRDLMRGHKFLLRNAYLRVLFDRWLLQRQYQLVRVSESMVPIFKKPLPFSSIAQKNGEYWHIPYTNTHLLDQKSSVLPSWLCIQC